MNLIGLLLGVAMASPTDVAIRAHFGDHTVWKVELKDMGRQRCKLVATGPDYAGGKTRYLRNSECASLKKLVDTARQELKVKQPISARIERLVSADEPHYQIKISEQMAALKFQAPNGEKSRLSAGQKLLIRLRDFANRARVER